MGRKPHLFSNTREKMRALHEIMADVRQDWRNVSPYAEPYVRALGTLNEPNDYYLLERGDELIRRFLANASGWRGERARAIKAELKSMLN